MALSITYYLMARAYSSSGSTSFVIPATLQAGDLGIIFGCNGNNETYFGSYEPIIPADFTKQGTQTSGQTNGRVWFTKKLVSGDLGRTISVGNSPSSWGWSFMAVRGAQVKQCTYTANTTFSLSSTKECFILTALVNCTNANGYTNYSNADNSQQLYYYDYPSGVGGTANSPIGSGWHNTYYPMLVLEPSASSLTTPTEGTIKLTKATFTSTLTIGTDSITDSGFCYSTTNSTPTTSDPKVSLGAKVASGNISTELSGMTAGGVLYVRAYATTSLGATIYSTVYTYTHKVISTGAVSTNSSISSILPNLTRGKTYYVRSWGIKQDGTTVTQSSATYYKHDWVSVGNLTLYSLTKDGSLQTTSVADLLIGQSYVYHICSNMNSVYVYNKSSDGTVGSYVGNYNWYSSDTTINSICRSGSSVPSAYALYIANGVEYLVGWSMDSAVLYEWTIDQSTHLLTGRQSYSVCSAACTSYSRGGWGGKNYVYFLNRSGWGVWRWDITNKTAAMVQLGTIPTNTLDSSYTGSGMYVNEIMGEIYYGDGSNESNGLLGAFNYKTGTQVGNIVTGPMLNAIGISTFSASTGNISISPLHPNIAYYIYFSGSTVRYITMNLGNNTAPIAPTLASPSPSGYTFNKRPPISINLPYDAEGDNVQVKATIKNGSTVLDTFTSDFTSPNVTNLVANAELKSATAWYGGGAASSSISGGVYSFTAGAQWGHVGSTAPVTCTAGDVLYYRAYVKNPYSTADLCRIGMGTLSNGSNVWTTVSAPINSSAFNLISGVVNTTTPTHYFAAYDTSASGWQQIQFHSPMILNLSKIFGRGKEPTKAWCDTNIKMIVNLIPNSGFENGTTGWTEVGTGHSVVTTDYLSGARSLKNLNSGQWHYMTPGELTIVEGHKYYMRTFYKPKGLGAGHAYEDHYWGTAGGTYTYAVTLYYDNVISTSWKSASTLWTAPATATRLTYACCAYDGTDNICEHYVDNVTCVDLTMAFGEGSEPTQTWCDANIPYFDGTFVKVNNSTIITNLIADGGYELGTSATSISGIVTSPVHSGTKAAKNYHTGQWTCALYSTIPVIPGHKYFVSSYLYAVNRGNGVIYSDVGFVIGGSYDWSFFYRESTLTNQWERHYGIITAPSNAQYICAAFGDHSDSSGVVELYLDDQMIVDLTAAFGAGNEPSVDWCNANIPTYFEGSYVMSMRQFLVTPSVDLPVGTITVDLEAYDGYLWSPKNSYTFAVSAVPTFSVQASDPGISKTNIDSLEMWVKNHKAFRGLSGTNEIIEDLTANTTLVKKAHIDAFRSEMTTLLSKVNITPTWTDPTIVAGQTLRKGTHWIEIFNYLKQV